MKLAKGKGKTMFQLIFSVAVLVFFDQWTKLLAVKHLKGQGDFQLIPDILCLRYLENRGAAFGVFQGQKVFLVLLTLVILLLVFYVLWKLPEEKKYTPLKILCFFVAAGGLGNFIDRIRQDYVVDFIYVKAIHFPIFNVADMYITVGVFLIFFFLLFWYRDENFEFLSIKKREKDR